MCGWPSVLSLLSITEDRDNILPRKILYENSGDRMSDKSRVVGYWSIAFYRKQTGSKNMSFELNSKEKELLLDIARNTLESFIRDGKIPEVDESSLSETLVTPAGAFVTLHKSGELRGCIGRFKPEKPLYKVIQDMAIASSTQDVRFPEVTEEELDEIDIEVSVLTPMEKVTSIDEIELGVHGVYIKKGNRSGTFLPQVAEMTNWSKEEFLGHCARDKAGLRWDEWKEEDTELYTYRAIIIKERPETD
jgi:AmmeMemoRadiSam system protein A